MYKVGEVIWWLSDPQHVHSGWVVLVLRRDYLVVDSEGKSWRIEPEFLGRTPQEARTKFTPYWIECEQVRGTLLAKRDQLKVQPNTWVEVHSPRYGVYRGYVLKVNRHTVDLWTSDQFRRVDKALILPIK